MPNLKGKEGYFFYSDDPNNIETFDAAPYGLARISGYLDAYNVPNKIIRLRDFTSSPKKEELEAIIKESDIIGISGLSNSAPEMFTFCLETKLKHPEKTIIGGREYFGLDSDWILKNKSYRNRSHAVEQAVLLLNELESKKANIKNILKRFGIRI